MDRYDVAVVGGGPAGAAAAYEAASRGADTVVLEKGVPRADREGLGPDSTDAAGMLDYWIEIMGIDPEELPDDVILRELSGCRFDGPSEALHLERTGMDADYPHFGYTFQRARMDDWLVQRAEDAGAEYRLEASVTGVDSDLTGDPEHEVALRSGENLVADRLVLADGPQRQVTNRVLDPLLPEGTSITDYLGTTAANHIAYQEHRRFPDDAIERDELRFWWGVMPGETAYPWVFPNDGDVARVGLTMPIGLDLEEVENREEYLLLDAEDESIPSGGEYIERLLERAYPEHDLEDFPLVEDRGKRGGTETYAISSTRPVDSPTAAGVAVAGGAMGTTSAFHEGGYHVAVRSGAIAGELAATRRLSAYNDAWKAAIGDEILRNVSFADIVADYQPADWDRAFRTARSLMQREGSLVGLSPSAGLSGLKLYLQYWWTKRGYRDGGYVQLAEDEYEV